MTLLFSTHTKCRIIEESGWSKIPVSLYDDEPCLYNYACNCHWYHYEKIKHSLMGHKRKSIESWLTLYQHGKNSLDPSSKLKEVLHFALPAVNFGGSGPRNQQESEM